MKEMNTLPRIDKYTCKFENPLMEERFMADKWLRVKTAISFALIFMSVVFVGDAYVIYEMLGGFEPVMILFPVFIGVFLSLLLDS